MLNGQESNIVTIVVAIIGLVGTVLGAKYGAQYQKVKSGFSKVVELLNVVNDAAKDDKIDEPEFQAIMDAVMKLKEGA